MCAVPSWRLSRVDRWLGGLVGAGQAQKAPLRRFLPSPQTLVSGVVSRVFTRCVKPANPRPAWVCGLRAAPVSVAAFGLTETGAGGFFGRSWSTSSCSSAHALQCLEARCWQLDGCNERDLGAQWINAGYTRCVPQPGGRRLGAWPRRWNGPSATTDESAGALRCRRVRCTSGGAALWPRAAGPRAQLRWIAVLVGVAQLATLVCCLREH